MTYLIIDAILVLIIILTAILSSKRGFVRSFIEVAGSIIVILLCVNISTPVSSFFFDKTVAPSMTDSIKSSIEEAGVKTEETVWDAIPDYITDNSSYFGITKETVTKKISIEDRSEIIADKTVNIVVKPILVKTFSLVLSVVLIVILLFAVKILARLLNKIFSFSILGSLNKLLGTVLGVFKGIVFCVLFTMIIILLMNLTKSDLLIFTKENINKTYLFKIIYGALPF